MPKGNVNSETRDRLIKAAIEEFSENGYAKASLRQICAKAGVTTGALYFFFKGKEELFNTIIEPLTTKALATAHEYYAFEWEALSEPRNPRRTKSPVPESIINLYYDNEDIGHILFDNAEQPAVQAFTKELLDLMTAQATELIGKLHPKVVGNPDLEGYTARWFASLQISSMSGKRSR